MTNIYDYPTPPEEDDSDCIFAICDCCGEPIYYDDKYYTGNGGKLCWDCLMEDVRVAR